MALNRRIAVLLATATLLLTGCQTIPKSTGPSLGELEHRGQRYALCDLTDPAYRQASNNPFVHNFNIDTFWAQRDAAVTRE